MDAQDLPIWGIMRDVIDALRRGRNVVLTAPPGSGKTTQVPAAILDNNLIKGTILVVQPRRVAARSVGRRVADERDIRVGDEVGYVVRYDNQSSADTRILFMTDGVLLRFLEKDANLSHVGAVIFDEFHERRVITDVALGLVRTIQQRRKSLRIVVMSATMQSEQVARYLDAVSLVAEGRTYPVDVRYVPTRSSDAAIDAAAEQIERLHTDSSFQGDILAFFAGKGEIWRAEKLLAARNLKDLTVLSLHGEHARDAQDRVFQPVEGRKVILATNIAETSVTIPGVRAVVDTGYEKRADFDPDFGINRLTLTRVSKASADQRAGRAGREAPGTCVRLWSPQEHELLSDHATVEMQRTDIASVVLTLKSLGILDPLTFEFLDAPSTVQLTSAEQFLIQLGAVGEDRRLTPVGWRMVRLPLPPRYARMVVESERSGCLKDIASIAALMTGRPLYKTGTGDEIKTARLRFEADDSSDFFSLLRMFWLAQEHRWSREWCEEHGISNEALQEAIRLRRKIIAIAGPRGRSQATPTSNRSIIRRCILSGLLDRVAIRTDGRNYRLSNGFLCATDRNSIVKGRLIAAANVRLSDPRTKGGRVANATLALATKIDLDMLRQLAPHMLHTVRTPLELLAADAHLSVREDVCYEELVLESSVKKVDLIDGLQIIAEQRQRAKRNAWHRVEVAPGVRGVTHIMWEGRKIMVKSDHVGPYWAAVTGSGPGLTVALRERIIVLPSTEEAEQPPLPPRIGNKVERTKSVVAKLIAK